ncbi:MAG: TIGR00730 family Rossman fold protein [Pirellulaceae bacterium]|nr:TIGR00730 family Rossman fold protein [Pirellulaceae bacterium]
MKIQSLCVFCGSSSGARPEYAAAARSLACLLVEGGTRLIYGGGNVGLMGILADEMLAQGGTVIGVIPRHLLEREVGHLQVTELKVVGSMHERKALMADLADAFVALPGGIGTFEELFEILTWAQLGLHDKPCGLLDVAGYYQPLIEMLRRAAAERFLRPEHLNLLTVATDPAELLTALAGHRPAPREKWLDRDET